ncbi:MAG: hypothetical protein AB1442_09915 [Nitrospirota bacterium]
MATRTDYNEIAVKAARSVLLELAHLLGEYREDMVLVGGWVPEFIFANKVKPHCGSIDVDLALDHRKLQEQGYKSIQKLLLSRGYEQGKQPYIFHRRVFVEDQEIIVQVDLLAGEYEGTGKSHRTQRMQDVLARKARGCDLAFDMVMEVPIEGELPGGGKDSVTIRVATIVPFLIMKGMALEDRLKEKDSWDIYYSITNYPGGLDGLVEVFRPYLKHGLVREGLEKIAKKFATEKDIGPKFVADFEEITDPEEREILQRDAYERVNYLLTKLGIV